MITSKGLIKAIMSVKEAVVECNINILETSKETELLMHINKYTVMATSHEEAYNCYVTHLNQNIMSFEKEEAKAIYDSIYQRAATDEDIMKEAQVNKSERDKEAATQEIKDYTEGMRILAEIVKSDETKELTKSVASLIASVKKEIPWEILKAAILPCKKNKTKKK